MHEGYSSYFMLFVWGPKHWGLSFTRCRGPGMGAILLFSWCSVGEGGKDWSPSSRLVCCLWRPNHWNPSSTRCVVCWSPSIGACLLGVRSVGAQVVMCCSLGLEDWNILRDGCLCEHVLLTAFLCTSEARRDAGILGRDARHAASSVNLSFSPTVFRVRI